jgi:hypothetical protein
VSGRKQVLRLGNTLAQLRIKLILICTMAYCRISLHALTLKYLLVSVNIRAWSSEKPSVLIQIRLIIDRIPE